jgi:hypothetical protein
MTNWSVLPICMILMSFIVGMISTRLSIQNHCNFYGGHNPDRVLRQFGRFKPLVPFFLQGAFFGMVASILVHIIWLMVISLSGKNMLAYSEDFLRLSLMTLVYGLVFGGIAGWGTEQEILRRNNNRR